LSRPDRLDFGDPTAMRAWFVDLRVAFDDATAVTEDLLRRKRRRTLGHTEHRRLHREAKKTITHLLDYAYPPSGGEPEGPSGHGSAGPAH
jgi:hypothetical protein